jgi:hypothetical protein
MSRVAVPDSGAALVLLQALPSVQVSASQSALALVLTSK